MCVGLRGGGVVQIQHGACGAVLLSSVRWDNNDVIVFHQRKGLHCLRHGRLIKTTRKHRRRKTLWLSFSKSYIYTDNRTTQYVYPFLWHMYVYKFHHMIRDQERIAAVDERIPVTTAVSV